MRVVVIGTSGAGKSTLAAQIAAGLDVALIELDALNWRPGWVNLSVDDPAQFLAHVDAATLGPGWVVAGNYTTMRHIVWARATHLIWLDYPKSIVMRRVLRRSFLRAWRQEAIWGGNRESFRGWLDPGHPVQWAWRTWGPNRVATIERLAEPHAAHLRVIRLGHPKEAGAALAALIGG